MPEMSIEEARAAMIAKRFGGNTSGAATGGGGSVRRKKKGAVKSKADDSKLSGILKKMSPQNINGVEEVNIFRNNNEVIHITQPKIQASIPSNTFVVSGNVEVKQLTEMLPGVLNQLGPEHMERLKAIAQQFAAAGGLGSSAFTEEAEEDDDEVPELVENFEEAANK